MAAFLLKRGLQSVLTLLVLSFVIWGLLSAMPGDPLRQQLMSSPDVTPEDIAALEEAWGLDDPWYERYVKWWGRILEGDLGTSMQWQRPVSAIIPGRIRNTIILTLSAFLLSLAIAIPAGVHAARRQYEVNDYLLNGLAFLGISIPSFWLGLIAILLFARTLHLFPSGLMSTPGVDSLLDSLWHLVLPTFVLAFQSIGTWIRYTRGSMLEVLGQDYIRTARSKGLDEETVVWKHAFRNGLIPVITIVALSLPHLVSGALVTETIFAWPGMGRLLYDSVIAKDFYVAVFSFLLLAGLTLGANFLADVAYALADPRVRLGGRET